MLVTSIGIDFAVPIHMLDITQWRHALAVRLDGAFLATRAALPYMYDQGGGRIIYIGSAPSEEASELMAPYIAAKHGLIGLAEVVAREGGKHGVDAKVIWPGFMHLRVLDRHRSHEGARLGVARDGCARDVLASVPASGDPMSPRDAVAAALAFAMPEPLSKEQIGS